MNSRPKASPFLATLALLASVPAAAADTGFYAGGSIGSSQQKFDTSTFNVRGDETGYEFSLGFRPLSVLGAELSYTNFGRAYGGINFANTDAEGLFAVGFLPIPVVDVFGKLGVAQWRTDAQSPFLSFHRTGANVAYGFGAGTSWGNLGARVEYERFEVSHASDMGLATIGLTWAFL
ncbi:MAG TPA: outer membrane beta-barrel protein [Steroidobacteraceae bacterium]